jgi:hypothetical protein
VPDLVNLRAFVTPLNRILMVSWSSRDLRIDLCSPLKRHLIYHAPPVPLLQFHNEFHVSLCL